MIIPGNAYPPPQQPPQGPPDPSVWDYGEGPPPEPRTVEDGPWLDVTTGVLYVPQEA